MRAVEFETLLKCDNSLEVPQEVAEQIPKDQRVQVIVLFPEPSEEDGADDEAWWRVGVVEWRKAGLLAPSTMRLHKLAREKNGVRRRLGRLQEADQGAFWKAFRRVYCDSPSGGRGGGAPG